LFKTSAFSILVLTVTDFPYLSTLFKSQIPTFVLRLLLIYFQLEMRGKA